MTDDTENETIPVTPDTKARLVELKPESSSWDEFLLGIAETHPLKDAPPYEGDVDELEDIGREIQRECSTCGATLDITVYESGEYEGGHYFGEFTVPDKESDGEYEKAGEWEGHDTVKWTGEEATYEYWECDDCYYE